MADNAISRQSDLQPMLDAALLDPRVDALVVAIGTGELICQKRQTKRHNPHPTARMPGGLAGPDRERGPPSDPRDLTVLILRDVNIGTTTNASEAVALPLPLRTTQAEIKYSRPAAAGTFKRLMSIARPPGSDLLE